MRMKNSGKMNPTAANASGPRPATQTASMRLLADWAIIAMIKGTDMAMMAFLGFPNNVSTPLVFCSMLSVIR